MTNVETKTFKAALEAKRQELIRRIRSNAAGLILQSDEAELIDQIQGMAGRDEIAIMLNSFSSTLEDVERSPAVAVRRHIRPLRPMRGADCR